ncbi:hypothetical protein ACFQ3P_36065 [Paraburkholderia sabiae]|uniref:Uncharacterized protein n=1 Tax=Paraburkholderia sabiae TaxID=273251 RepID=A0ABU9QNL0_9BURK|nr:hypothetical protein [Paraburkholderia sabiae]WJZ72163.1 hypothetical protein QEN71_18460 [Paraburkholderia sabiae]
MAVYRTRFEDQNALFGELIDGAIWELAKTCRWSLAELETNFLCNVERMGLHVDDPRLNAYMDHQAFEGSKTSVRRRFFGRSSQWAWLSCIFFRMKRAEAVGNVERYAIAYNQLQSYLGLGRMIASREYRRVYNVEMVIFHHFCVMFSLFLSKWHSRVLLHNGANVDMKSVVAFLNRQGLRVWGQEVGKKGDLRYIAGRPFKSAVGENCLEGEGDRWVEKYMLNLSHFGRLK